MDEEAEEANNGGGGGSSVTWLLVIEATIDALGRNSGAAVGIGTNGAGGYAGTRLARPCDLGGSDVDVAIGIHTVGFASCSMLGGTPRSRSSVRASAPAWRCS